MFTILKLKEKSKDMSQETLRSLEHAVTYLGNLTQDASFGDNKFFSFDVQSWRKVYRIHRTEKDLKQDIHVVIIGEDDIKTDKK